MKIIALDYDDTYTADPGLWDAFIAMAKARGHMVVCVTFRRPDLPVGHDMGIEVFYTSGRQKAEFMLEQDLLPSIWIDDLPHLIGKPVI